MLDKFLRRVYCFVIFIQMITPFMFKKGGLEAIGIGAKKGDPYPLTVKEILSVIQENASDFPVQIVWRSEARRTFSRLHVVSTVMKHGLRKIGRLSKISLVRHMIKLYAELYGDLYLYGAGGEVVVKEQGYQDAVCFYIDNFLEAYSNVNWKFYLLRIIRHENRHLEQFQMLRQMGGSPYVKFALKQHANQEYGEDFLESDAYENQDLPKTEQSDIKKAVEGYVKTFPQQL